MSWNDERVELLKKLWAEGLSASQIANRLSGVTRNAVIGKVTRLGLPERLVSSRKSSGGRTKSLNKRRERQRAAAAARSKPSPRAKSMIELVFDAVPIEPVEELFIPVKDRKGVLQLEASDCRWPIGDPREPDFHFCGKGKVTGLPYCEHHVRRAYQPPKPSRTPGTPARSIPVVADSDSGGEGRVQTPANENATGGLPRAKETV